RTRPRIRTGPPGSWRHVRRAEAGLGVHLGRPGRLLGAGPGPYLGPAFLATVAPGQRAPEPSRRTLCATPGCVTDHRPRACRPHRPARAPPLEERSEEHTSELQSRFDLVCRLL